MKIFNTLEELHTEWEINGACKEGKKFNHSCKTLQEVFEKCPLNFRLWRLRHGYTQFEKHCNWNEIQGSDWAKLLTYKSKYAKYCDWNKLDYYDWVMLLDNHPRFIKYCNAEMLGKLNWEYLIQRHPQLKVYKPKKFKS